MYSICSICNWEDDGQDDLTANEIRGAANGDYSLSEPRRNFLQYRVMYEPDRDVRYIGGDTTLTFETKGALMSILKLLRGGAEPSEELRTEINRLEAVLRAETLRQAEQFDALERVKNST